MSDPHLLDPKFIAGVELLRRTGAMTFRCGYTDTSDGDPVIWHATCTWISQREADAALNPVEAVMRLCERVIDGGMCTHCKKSTIFIHDVIDPGPMLESLGGCIYAWDPELRVFRRGCE